MAPHTEVITDSHHALGERRTELDTLAPLIVAVPDVEDDGGTRILAQILAATKPEDLDAPWNANGFRSLVGRQVQINTIHKMPSDFEASLGWYLVAEGVRLDNGDAFVATTGSASIMAQLVRAWNLNAFPIECEVCEATSKRDASRKPMHLAAIRSVAR